MKRIYDYLNGNVRVQLFDNGTKIIECDDELIPDMEYPMSMDIKITNKCDLGCSFCHEMSTKDGKHGNTSALVARLAKLPAGTELALGGGNPLVMNNLKGFLQALRKYELVPNLTINYYHIKPYADLINELIDEKLIFGLGISIPETFDNEVINLIKNKKNCVYHIITGIHPNTIFQEILDSPINKVLILGYKTVGRGIEYNKYHEDIWSKVDKMSKFLDNMINGIHYSFDNLAITQLKIKDKVSEEYWRRHYMGNDGQFTMYMDAVKWEYALSSTAYDKFDMGKMEIQEMFKHIKSL